MPAKIIIIADDDLEDQTIIQDAMASLNASDILIFADNGEELFNLLNRDFPASLSPCLIVLDMNMPKMNGIETLQKLKGSEHFNHIPVIIYSTSINPVEREQCLLLGAHSFITKPISYKESCEVASTFLRFCEPKFN